MAPIAYCRSRQSPMTPTSPPVPSRAPLHPALAPHWLVAAPRCRVAVLEAVATAPRRMPRHSAPRLPAPSLRPTPRRWACGRCLTAATRPLLRSGYSRWSGAIIASRSVRRAELRRDARGLPAWPFGRAVEHFFCTDPVWPESAPARHGQTAPVRVGACSRAALIFDKKALSPAAAAPPPAECNRRRNGGAHDPA